MKYTCFCLYEQISHLAVLSLLRPPLDIRLLLRISPLQAPAEQRRASVRRALLECIDYELCSPNSRTPDHAVYSRRGKALLEYSIVRVL